MFPRVCVNVLCQGSGQEGCDINIGVELRLVLASSNGGSSVRDHTVSVSSTDVAPGRRFVVV